MRKYLNIKKDIVLAVVSVLFGILNVAGQSMYFEDRLPVGMGIRPILSALGFAVIYSVIFYIAACALLSLFDKMELKQGEKPKKLKGIWRYADNHIFWVSFFFILIMWLPWVIVYYPASMDWDVYRQLSSYLGIWAHSNHDPWFSSCVLGICYQLGVKLGSENLGIFIFVIIRDILMAFIYAKCIQVLKKAGLKRWIYYLALCFYAVTPVWGAYSKHAFKDTFCCALFVWYIISLIVLIMNQKEGDLKRKHCVSYGTSALFLSLFRNNCVYVAAPITFLVVIYLLVKREKCIYSILIVALLGIYFAFNSFIFNYCGVEPGSGREALSIPFQQTARTVRDHSDEITEEERMAINNLLDYDSMAENYDPLLSDPIKDHMKSGVGKEAIMDYFITWFKMFFKYPWTYIEAGLGQSYGYYAFTPRFPYGAGNYNSGMTIFNWIQVDAFQEYYSFHYVEQWEKGRNVLADWADLWDKIPVLNWTNKIPLYTWSIFLLGYYLLKKRRLADVLPILALLIMILTCMASPVNGCFRYFAPVAASSPALLLLLGRRSKRNVPDDREL